MGIHKMFVSRPCNLNGDAAVTGDDAGVAPGLLRTRRPLGMIKSSFVSHASDAHPPAPIARSPLNKLLTIVMPAYNMEAYLGGALDSILACKRADRVEALVVDDGSTDATPQVIATFEQKAPNVVRGVRKENGHYGSAVNRGIAEATGDYVKVVDSDDWVDGGALDELLAFLESAGEVDLVLSDYVRVFEDCEEPVSVADIPPRKVLPFSDVRLRPCIMHAITYRRDVLRKSGLRLDEGILFTDDEYALFPTAWVNTLAYVPEPVYRYRLGRAEQSVSPENLERTLADNWQVAQAVMAWRRSLAARGVQPANLAYVNEKCAAIAYEHIRRRLLSSDAEQGRRVTRELEAFLTDDVGIAPADLERHVRFLRATDYAGWGVLAAYKKRRAKG
ncbi:glycosyltransferase [Eggerthellaceae bacterium zg-886]|uniref:Glycosyltransferase n=1 Tax=Xiamenia xianingshaonis TaxID=2682776 RepID=A0ABX0ING7_9ACTN|nr:glycosyltransferase [Xiamenia xianingshaonis]